MTGRVIVAGGGPAGLLLAAELALGGVPSVVLERRAEHGTASPGMAIHGRSLELLRQRGLAGRIAEGDIFAWPRTPFAFLWLDLDTVDEREYTYAYPQWRTEALLRERAVELGVDIRYGHEVTGFHEDADGVTVEVNAPDGTETIRAGYLVGADGAESAVRERAGIGFPGEGWSYYGVLGDVELREGERPEFATGLFETGMFGALPLQPGRLRLMTIEFDTTGPGRDVPVTVDELRASVVRVTGTDQVTGEAGLLHRYGGTTRLADRYRKGRILLVGDAAHSLYISGTQGLNTALHDAFNLGWKLAATVRGGAPAGLLDTYEAERRPVGERVCVHARAQAALMYPLNRVGPLRELLQDLLGVADVNRFLLEYPTRDGDTVPDVPLTVLDGPGPATVAEALHAGRGVLLDLSGGAADLSVARPWADRVPVVRAAPSGEIGAALLLVRPDGRVAYAGPDATGLRDALTAWFGEPARAADPVG